MKVSSHSFPNGAAIPEKYALGVPHPKEHVTFGENLNPHLRWSDAPQGTQSFAIICHDPDVPSVGDDVNQEGQFVPRDLSRVDFYHWVLVDIPPEIREIPEGAVSGGVAPRGKAVGLGPFGKAGRNDYTGWFSGDGDMEGEYGGYDGPGPPWNDERLHHYHFTVYALDTPKLDLPESFGGDEARAAMNGRVLQNAEWVGTYSLNPRVRAT
ncbi:MAG: YbhB/YbcL family Raf kinase inhibitor-like protein [Gemmatimonas sp.]|nr:YbhB/YbcL family Raf kinase inhibitor-like protein [Gemmatimonas sp.]